MDATSPATQQALVERFLRYSSIPTQSDASCEQVPSSPGQWELARMLADELREAGALDVHLSETCVLNATVPAHLPPGHPTVPAVGFCVHLDTADAGLSASVSPRVVTWTGEDLQLDAAGQVWLRAQEHPALAAHVGQQLLVTDGTSVLGADDKAGIAAVMQAATRLLADPPFPHGEVRLVIVPDEEIGLRGVRTLELERFAVQMAWTLDCCAVGEAVWQTFNAASARVEVQGVSAHPMSAKDVLVNPILVAHDLVALLDRSQTPEHTEGTQGYTWVRGVTGDESSCRLDLDIRDHDRAGFARRKAELQRAVDQVGALHPRARVSLQVQDTYGNIDDALGQDRRSVELMLQAMRGLGIEPRPLAMRGGTDGSWLSRQGIPTPNFFTGAHNFHSVHEFLPLESFALSHAVVLELVRLTAETAVGVGGARQGEG